MAGQVPPKHRPNPLAKFHKHETPVQTTLDSQTTSKPLLTRPPHKKRKIDDDAQELPQAQPLEVEDLNKSKVIDVEDTQSLDGDDGLDTEEENEEAVRAVIVEEVRQWIALHAPSIVEIQTKKYLAAAAAKATPVRAKASAKK